VVVQGRVVAGRDIGACSVLQLPVPQRECPGLVVQLSGGGVTAPVVFDGLLQFASQADAWKAQIAYGGDVHVLLGSWSPPRAIRSRADTREGTRLRSKGATFPRLPRAPGRRRSLSGRGRSDRKS